jgi:hypothetical protein
MQALLSAFKKQKKEHPLKLLLYSVLGILILISLYLCSFSVLHGEVNFFNDVARDFLLFQEIDQKKIVLIGARTNFNGLFHGPIWIYMNYPAYLLGHGNPVVVALFWLLLAVAFFITSFFIAKKLFDTLTALFYVLLLEVGIGTHLNGLFQAEANALFMPAFIFSIYRYLQTKRAVYLVVHLVVVAIIIQLNIGVGPSLFILSSILIFWFVLRNKLWKHLLAFFIIPLGLLNFIIFDLRHGFGMTKAVIKMMSASKLLVPLNYFILDRVRNTLSLQMIQNTDQLSLLIVFIMVIVFTTLQIRSKNKYKLLYLLFIFYYFGFMLSTITSKGILLIHFVFFLIPITSLWLVSFISGKYRMIFLPIVAIVFLFNFNYALSNVSYLKSSFMGKHPDSWISLSSVAKSVIREQKGKEFGYFVFSPDSFAYQPRYAMIYNFKTGAAKSSEYTKEATTYVIAAPPPPDNIYMNQDWWIRVLLKITSKPVEIKTFPSGYKIEKFNLTPEEQKIPFDKSIELGISFR